MHYSTTWHENVKQLKKKKRKKEKKKTSIVTYPSCKKMKNKDNTNIMKK